MLIFHMWNVFEGKFEIYVGELQSEESEIFIAQSDLEIILLFTNSREKHTEFVRFHISPS